VKLRHQNIENDEPPGCSTGRSVRNLLLLAAAVLKQFDVAAICHNIKDLVLQQYGRW
jgi:hypothetical protein